MSARLRARLRRAYALLLRAYPRPFRRRFGEDMEALFADRLAEVRSPVGAVSFAARTAADLAGSIPREWLAAGRPALSRGLDGLRLDLRQGRRVVRRRPGLAVAGVATLALGIGVATALFSIAHGILLEPLPFPEPDRLVWIRGTRLGQPGIWSLSRPDFQDFDAAAGSFSSMGLHTWIGSSTLEAGGERERVRRTTVSGGFFGTLGVQPALGRLFDRRADAPGAPREVVLSDGLWRRRFGARPGVVGETIAIDGAPWLVVGVLPPGRFHPESAAAPDPEIWLRMEFEGWPRDARNTRAVGRLAPGVSPNAARAELEALAADLARAWPEQNQGCGVHLEGLHEAQVGAVRPALLLLFAAAGLLLAAACASLAQLLLAGAVLRREEVAVRRALGAGASRVVRLFLIEGLGLAAVGAALGVPLAVILTRACVAAAGPALPRAWTVGVDGSAVAFSVLAALAAGIAIAAPAARSALRDPAAGLEGRSALPRRRHGGALVVAEVAVAVVLCAGALLLVRSLDRLGRVDPGVRTDGVVAVEVALSVADVPEGEQTPFFQALYAALRSQPGIEAAGGTDILPLADDHSCDGFQVLGHEVPPGEEPCAEARSVSPGYFAATSMRILEGRGFDDRDGPGAPAVALVSESFARLFLPGGDAIGQRLVYPRAGGGDPVALEVVGVVSDVRHFGLASPLTPTFYTPHGQPPSFHRMHVVVRSSLPVETSARTIREVARRIRPDVAVGPPRPLRELVGVWLAPARFRSLLLGLIAASAAVVALVGVTGVTAFGVSQRRREIGVRMALGASGRAVVTGLLLGGLRPVLAGLVAGLLVAAVASRLIEGLLFGVPSLDPATFLGLPPALLAVASLAILWPAASARRIDPARALQER